jgi:hypothetical protein
MNMCIGCQLSMTISHYTSSLQLYYIHKESKPTICTILLFICNKIFKMFRLDLLAIAALFTVVHSTWPNNLLHYKKKANHVWTQNIILCCIQCHAAHNCILITFRLYFNYNPMLIILIAANTTIVTT